MPINGLNMRSLLLAMLIAWPALAQAQTAPPVTCPAGYGVNSLYASSPLTQAPCLPVIPPVTVAPVAPVTVDPTLYYLQQQQLQQMQREQEMQRWRWEHEQHPDHPPGH